MIGSAGPRAGMSLLEVRGLDVHYGDFQAIYGIDVTVEEVTDQLNYTPPW